MTERVSNRQPTAFSSDSHRLRRGALVDPYDYGCSSYPTANLYRGSNLGCADVEAAEALSALSQKHAAYFEDEHVDLEVAHRLVDRQFVDAGFDVSESLAERDAAGDIVVDDDGNTRHQPRGNKWHSAVGLENALTTLDRRHLRRC